jgi:superfamily II DNA or RNA helicase
MQLRPYQLDAVNKVKQSFAKGHKRVILRLDCGSGKTAISADMCIKSAKKGNEVLFLVHRKELLDQTYETFEMFEDYHKYKHKIKIGMILSVGNRLDQYDPQFIVADECNFSLAKSWRKVIEHYDNAWTLGLSATPIRLDGKALGDIYDDIVEGVDAQWLIDNGYLAPYDYYAPSTEAIEYKMRGMDFSMDDVTAKLMKSKIYGKVEDYIDNSRKTIIYCPSIEFSKALCDRIGATHFDGNTKKKDRDRIIKDFRKGNIRVLSNVDLVGEGFDVPDCDTVILLRPTMSLSLYIQQSMRCLRPRPGKRATIYDLVGNCYRHGLPTEKRDWSLEGRMSVANKSGEPDIVVRRCDKCQLIYSGTASVCPYCGYNNGKTKREIEQERQAELEKIEQLEKKKERMEQGRAKTLQELIAIGKARGYKSPYWWARKVLNSRQKDV